MLGRYRGTCRWSVIDQYHFSYLQACYRGFSVGRQLGINNRLSVLPIVAWDIFISKITLYIVSYCKFLLNVSAKLGQSFTKILASSKMPASYTYFWQVPAIWEPKMSILPIFCELWPSTADASQFLRTAQRLLRWQLGCPQNKGVFNLSHQLSNFSRNWRMQGGKTEFG